VRSGQLGSVPAPAASRARGFNPGQAPNHREIGVTPPGLDREKPRGIWGAGVRCRLGLLPTPSHKKRRRGSGGKCVRSLPAAVAYPLPGGWGVGFPRTRFASRPQPKPRALLAKIHERCWRFPVIARAAGGARCLINRKITGSSVLKCEAWDFSLFCRSQSFC